MIKKFCERIEQSRRTFIRRWLDIPRTMTTVVLPRREMQCHQLIHGVNFFLSLRADNNKKIASATNPFVRADFISVFNVAQLFSDCRKRLLSFHRAKAKCSIKSELTFRNCCLFTLLIWLALRDRFCLECLPVKSHVV